MQITNFMLALEFLNGGRDKSRRTVPGIRSTYVEKLDSGRIAVFYHATPVVTYHANGAIVLNTGGFRTSTTKSRINTFANVNVFQKNFVWYLNPHTEFCDLVNVGKSEPQQNKLFS